jgi:uncharacterized membrane protein YhaH (DUF805 family)
MITRAVLDASRSTFVYAGRSERLEHWAFLLFTFLWVLLFQLAGRFGLVALFPLNYVFLFVFLWLLLANVSLMVRRLHDHDLSGFWMFVPLIPVAAMLVAAKGLYGSGFPLLTSEGAALLFKVSQGATVGVFVVFGSLFVRPGDKKPNRFGAAP